MHDYCVYLMMLNLDVDFWFFALRGAGYVPFLQLLYQLPSIFQISTAIEIYSTIVVRE